MAFVKVGERTNVLLEQINSYIQTSPNRYMSTNVELTMSTKLKQWGIRVRDSGWLQTSDYQNKYQTTDAIYYRKAEAVKDAKEFNRMRKENIYQVEEYK